MTTANGNSEKNEEAQLITFHLGNGIFAVSVGQVREIGMAPTIANVPDTVDYIEGVMNLRGQVTTVIDLRKRFRIPINQKAVSSDQSRIIVAELDGNLLGLTVDAVDTVVSVPKSSISPPPKLLAGGMEGKYLVGICKLHDKLVMLIDLNKIIGGDEAEQLRSVKDFIANSNAVVSRA